MKKEKITLKAYSQIVNRTISKGASVEETLLEMLDLANRYQISPAKSPTAKLQKAFQRVGSYTTQKFAAKLVPEGIR